MPDSAIKKLEFRIKAVYLWLFRLFFRKGKPLKIPLDRNSFKSILIIRPDRLGDTICSLPLVDALKKHIPDVKIGIFASDKNRVLVKNDPRFDKVYIYRRNLFKDMSAAFKIRQEQYDCIIDLMADDSATSLSIVQVCSGKSPRIGVGKRNHARYFDYNEEYKKGGEGHIIDIYLRLMKIFGIDPLPDDGYAGPFLDPENKHKAVEFTGRINPEKDKQLIGFNLSVRLSNRIWGHDKSCWLISMLLNKHEGCEIVLITAPPDRHKADNIQKEFETRVHQVPKNLSFLDACAIISELDMLISADTSLVHVARAFEVPVIGMYPEFGNIFKQWYPYGQIEGLVLSKGEDNIFNVTPDQVMATFDKVTKKIAKQ